MVASSTRMENVGLFPSLTRFLLFTARVAALELKSQDKFRRTTKRAVIFCIVTLFVPCVMIWNHVGFLLDDLLFGNWKTFEVRAPLFLVGNARSGTTWLHRLITHNSRNFTTMKTWEIVFAASVTWRWLFGMLHYMDRRFLGSILYTALMRMEALLIDKQGFQVHPTGLMEAEEDEWLMVHVGYSQLILFFFPLGGELVHDIIVFDCATEGTPDTKQVNHLASHIRREIFAYYKQCVQRHVYYHSHYDESSRLRAVSTQLTFVSKNPAFTLRIPTIYATFPDARVVSVLRDPIQSVPSMISYISKVWHTFAEPVERYPDARQLLGFCRQHYLFPLLHLREGTDTSGGHPVNQWAFVSYHHLLADLENVVLRLLARLYGPQWSADQPTTQSGNSSSGDAVVDGTVGGAGGAAGCAHSVADLQEFRAYLRQEQVKARSYRTQHMHSVAQCCGGMSELELQEELRRVYEEHLGAFS